MLKIIYNDSYSQLTIIDNLNEEFFVVIDDEFNTYETFVYRYREPTKDDLIFLFKQSLKYYFDLENKLKHFLSADLRQDMAEKSLKLFCEWLNEHKELWGGEE